MANNQRPHMKKQIRKTIKSTVQLRQQQSRALKQRQKRAIVTEKVLSPRAGTAHYKYRMKAPGIGELVQQVPSFDIKQMKGTLESTAISYIDYDVDTLTLVIIFWKVKIRHKRVVARTKGGKYMYFQVPFKIYSEFIGANSKGRYFNKNIKGRYRFVPL